MRGSSDKRDSLLSIRTELAKALREGRKKGVIPVLISFLWFVFALGLSIDLAFNDIGGNETAHNLAIGLLVGWLPVLIVGCAVDRNLVSADSIREKFNELLNEVQQALRNVHKPGDRFQLKTSATAAAGDIATRLTLNEGKSTDEDFFEGFGGQGRTHFHYGVAHPVLSGVETKFIANYGRDWLRDGHAARHAMVMGSRNVNGLKMFDARMVWQILSSLTIVGGTIFAAFILSWFTPTVGLGCRTGGYLIYVVIALGLLAIEMCTWWLTHDTTHTDHDPLRRVGSRLHRHFSKLSSEKQSQMSERTKSFLHWFLSGSFRGFIRNFVLCPIEASNTGWLTYIIFAQ